MSGATFTSNRFCNVDSAYGFDGVNDYIKILLNKSDERKIR